MIDLDQVRKRHTRATSCCVCEETLSTYSLVCSVCGETSNNPRDPSVLALCDEVEALRAQVAAAPEVLREWPKAAGDAPGEWVLVTDGPLSRGVFRWCSLSDKVYFRDSSGRSQFPELRPGEFFVRAP